MKLNKIQEERAKALHETCLVFDMHSDIQCELIRRYTFGETRILDRVFYPSFRKGGIDAIWFSTPPHLMHYPSYRGDYIRAGMHCMDVTLMELEECGDCFSLATKTEEIFEARKNGKIAVLLGFEGADPVGEDLGNLRNYYRLGLREIQLTWNYKNQVCDGIYEKRNAGLTEFGRELIKEMNRLGILIDVSHINHRALEDTLDASSQPIYMSHTSSRALLDHPRNITDDQAKAITEKGGIIGVCFLPQFVAAGAATVEHVLDHLDHFVEQVGSDHVGLGPDFIDYCLEVMRGALKGIAYDSGETFHYPKGVEDVSGLLNITRGMVVRGYSDHDIENVLGGSMLRLLAKVIG